MPWAGEAPDTHNLIAISAYCISARSQKKLKNSLTTSARPAESRATPPLLRERIIPRSVLYFTGEAIEDDDDDYDEEGEEADEEGEEEGDEENDPDYDPKKDQNPAECKQQ